MLRETAGFVRRGVGTVQRVVKGYGTRVIVLNTVHRPRSQAGDEPQHARLWVHTLFPDKIVIGDPYTRKIRKKIVFPIRSGDSLDKKRHLFVLLVEASLEPIGQGILIHGTGKHLSYRFDETLIPFFG